MATVSDLKTIVRAMASVWIRLYYGGEPELSTVAYELIADVTKRIKEEEEALERERVERS